MAMLMVTNLQGLTNKKTEFNTTIEINQPDLVIACETKITAQDRYKPPYGYNIFETPAMGTKGGIIILVKESLKPTSVKCPNPPPNYITQACACEIYTENKTPILVMGIYHSKL